MTAMLDQLLDLGVDGIAVINLDRRPDRWEQFCTAWGHRSSDERIVRVAACEGTAIAGYGQRPWFRGRRRDRGWAGRAGCTLSHVRALQLAQGRGWARVLILEDDAVPAAGLVDAVRRGLGREDWALFYLGCQEPKAVRSSGEPGLDWIGGALQTHAYIATAPLAGWLLERLPGEAGIWSWIAEQRALDRWFRREIGRSHRILACDPPVVVQADGGSDIAQNWSASTDPDHREPTRRSPFADAIETLALAVEPVRDLVRGKLKRLFGF